jgi:DNA-binding response OmpR family regulator
MNLHIINKTTKDSYETIIYSFNYVNSSKYIVNCEKSTINNFQQLRYDYPKKPFHLKELNIRINNLLKIRQITSTHRRLSKSYSFDLSSCALLFNNTPVKLRRCQLQVIELLAKNRGITVSFEMFRHYICEDEIVQDSTITSEIYRLKKSLKEDFITNIRNIGHIVNIPN